MTKEKKIGLLVNLIVYVVAFAIGFVPYYFVMKNGYPIEAMFIFTMVATLVVVIPMLIIKNTSLYDPYWSVAPFVMAVIHMIFVSKFTINSIIFTAITFWYAFRLTLNWAITYKGLNPKYEDWRYADFRHSLPAWKFQFINLTGLTYVPTIVVFAALVPGFYFMDISTFNPLTIIGLVIMAFGPLLELIADHQTHKFIKDCNDHSKVCDYGLWKYSRHPNYLGELTFWFGIAVTMLLADITQWYVCLGYILMVVLFFLASIPLMEKHNLKKRPSYKEYQKTTSVLLILPRKK